MSSVGVGVVGLGYWGPNLVRNFQELSSAHVVAVCDPRGERRDLIVRRYPSVRPFDDFTAMLESDEIDAVAIATPVSTHYLLAAAALTAGKHVFVEKPLAASSAEANELIHLAAANGRVLMPGHTFVYSPPVMAIRDLIASGDLGQPYFISTTRVNLGLHQSDVSVTWDLGPHDFSILRYWLDETPSHVTALSRGFVMPSIPDVAFIGFEFASGVLANVELSWLAPSKLRRTTLVCSDKMVVYDDTSNEPVRIFDSGVHPRDPESFGEYRLTYRTGPIVSPPIDATEPLSLELRDFCDAVATGSTPRSSALLGLEVVRMVEAVDRSIAESGARVAIGDLGPPRLHEASSSY
jgi:predicted dehydrogenase